MARFPTYPDELPACLRPLRPSHYALLTYWIYFRPAALKSYLYQALPALYQSDGQPGLLQRWANPAFRNLAVMVPTTSLIVTFLLSLPVTLLFAWGLDVTIDWSQWSDGMFLGAALGVTLGIAFGVVGRVMGSPALGAIMSSLFGVTIGVLGGVTLSAAFGIAFANLQDGVLVVGAIAGILGGMAVTLDVEMGVALGLALGVMGGLSFCVEYLLFQIFGIRFGALLVRAVMSGAFVFGAFRGPFYPFQFGLALFSFLPGVRHPLKWDELVVLPLPWTRRMLAQELRRDQARGLTFLTTVWRNLFYRPSLQVVLYRTLHRHPAPLRFVYSLLTDPKLDEYMLIPVTEQQWRHNINVRQALLGEFALRLVEATHNPRFRRSSWWLNLHLFRRSQTPLTEFAGMLYDLLTQQAEGRVEQDLAAYSSIYNRLKPYPDGQEIALSFEALATFLEYQKIADFPEAATFTRYLQDHLTVDDAIRPSVLTALARLGQVGTDVALYQQADSHAEQLAALARATGDLNELTAYVDEHVMAPEQQLLQQIIRQWQQVIMDTIGNIGKTPEVTTPSSQLEFAFVSADFANERRS
jgi:hypothetical protein